jgi:hypothetical protein
VNLELLVVAVSDWQIISLLPPNRPTPDDVSGIACLSKDLIMSCHEDDGNRVIGYLFISVAVQSSFQSKSTLG